MGKLTFILGGARSGKSRYAMQLARQHPGAVTYLATAQALDPEMDARIARHRQERPAGWQTLEIPTQVGVYLQHHPPEGSLILLDCLTMLVSNLLMQAGGAEDRPDEAGATQAIDAEVEALLGVIRSGPADWIVVSNEVGMGLVPPYPMGRLYRDLLGLANQRFAAQAAEFYFMVAGIPMKVPK
jgi:adenosylcobinamide kinase/adenosylcobinamide-phosphate guanylyltransferase